MGAKSERAQEWPSYEDFHGQVAFSETDAAGVAHFTSLLIWAENAEHQLMIKAGLMKPGLGNQVERIGWPRVKINCDYYGSLRFADEYRVRLQLAKVGRSSLTWHFFILNGSNLEPVAEGEMVVVKLGIEGRSMALSEQEIARLSDQLS